MINIIFLLDLEKKPSGGKKIIYQFCSNINSLKNYKGFICLVEKKRINKLITSIKKKFKINTQKIGWEFTDLKISKKKKLNWNNSNVYFKNSFVFDKEKDFIILPEIFAHFATEFFLEKKIPYAIFVQNGYAIFPTNDKQKLNLAYNNAKFILSYSKDIDECVVKAFPKSKNKILKVVPAINHKKLTPNKTKENLITYMPRKLAKHSELVLSFLQTYLPKNWKIKPLDNLTEKEVFYNLKKSKLFMSFSELEGLGMPPIEAALAGNKVIGYTGEAGKEYWSPPIFKEVKNGNIKKFCDEVLHFIRNNKSFNFNNQRKVLLKKYSVANQEKSILNFLKKIS